MTTDRLQAEMSCQGGVGHYLFKCQASSTQPHDVCARTQMYRAAQTLLPGRGRQPRRGQRVRRGGGRWESCLCVCVCCRFNRLFLLLKKNLHCSETALLFHAVLMSKAPLTVNVTQVAMTAVRRRSSTTAARSTRAVTRVNQVSLRAVCRCCCFQDPTSPGTD